MVKKHFKNQCEILWMVSLDHHYQKSINIKCPFWTNLYMVDFLEASKSRLINATQLKNLSHLSMCSNFVIFGLVWSQWFEFWFINNWFHLHFICFLKWWSRMIWIWFKQIRFLINIHIKDIYAKWIVYLKLVHKNYFLVKYWFSVGWYWNEFWSIFISVKVEAQDLNSALACTIACVQVFDIKC